MDLQEEFRKLDLQKSFVVGFFILGLYWLTFYDDGSSTQNLIDLAKQSQNQNKASLLQVEQAIADQKKFDEEIKMITRNMKDFDHYFDPSNVSSNQLQGKVSQLAEQHSLLVNAMKPATRTSEFPSYAETAIEFKIEGPFHNIMEFISSLTKIQKAIDFSKMDFKVIVKGDYPQVELSTILVVYSSTGVSEEGSG